MSTNRDPRFPGIRATLGDDVLDRRRERIDSELAQIREHPDRQENHFFLASAYHSMALELYALGYEIAEVVATFRRCVEARLRVLRLRGTGQYTSTRPPQAPGDEPVTTEHRDFGTGCSWYGYETACLAHMVDARDLVGEITRLIWDPPDADYVGRRSEICTPEQQRIAYALRDLGTPAFEQSRPHLRRISEAWRVRGFPKPLAYQAGLLLAIGEGDGPGFLTRLDTLLAWHEQMAEREANRADRARFLCLPALGLGALALAGQTIHPDDLPRDRLYLPTDLIGHSPEE
ncbi:MAG: hypothetical protein U0790_05005 [Isosphaeraceae bacterium]